MIIITVLIIIRQTDCSLIFINIGVEFWRRILSGYYSRN